MACACLSSFFPRLARVVGGPTACLEQEVGVGPAVPCTPVRTGSHCRRWRVGADWLDSAPRGRSANGRPERSKSEARHLSSAVAEPCAGSGSSGRRDPEATPQRDPNEPRRPGHGIPLIDHAIEGKDSYKQICWLLRGLWYGFSQCLFGARGG